MTEPASDSAPRPVSIEQPSFFDDLIEIFFHPTAVFRRNANKSAWKPMLFIAVLSGIIVFATFNTLQPIFEAEFARGAAKQMASNPQMTPEAMAKGRDIGLAITRYTFGIVFLITMFLLGVTTWLVSKLVGAATNFGQGLMVAAWAYMPRVIGLVIGGVQGLFMDTTKFTSQLSLSLSPARFMDPDTTNPLVYQMMGRFDLITIWVTILLAIGIYVTGKVSKERAAVFGLLIWLIGALPVIRAAFLAM